jgi:hypothetical protein
MATASQNIDNQYLNFELVAHSGCCFIWVRQQERGSFADENDGSSRETVSGSLVRSRLLSGAFLRRGSRF